MRVDAQEFQSNIPNILFYSRTKEQASKAKYRQMYILDPGVDESTSLNLFSAYKTIVGEGKKWK